MSDYTISIRKICDIYGNDEVEKWFSSYKLEDYLTQKQIDLINETGIWTKEKLAKKIIRHYFMREIGFETPALFKLMAEQLMEEIMEEKLPIIYTQAIDYDILVNENYTETFTRNMKNDNSSTSHGDISTEGSSSSTSTSSSSSLTINDDTPQTNINKQSILNGTYASSASANENTSTIEDDTTTSNSSTNDINSSGESNMDETYTRTVKGNRGISATYQAMIQQYRDNIVTVDKDIIQELNQLFLGIF